MPDASLATAVEFQAGGAAGSIFKKDSDCASSVAGKTQIRAIDNPNQSSFPKYDMSRSPQAFLNYRPMRLLASGFLARGPAQAVRLRSEEHTSELQSRGLISYAVF